MRRRKHKNRSEQYEEIQTKQAKGTRPYNVKKETHTNDRTRRNHLDKANKRNKTIQCEKGHTTTRTHNKMTKATRPYDVKKETQKY